MRAAVVGAGGYIGRHLAAAQPDGVHLTRRELDLGQRGLRLPALDGHTHVIVAAGRPAIADCERDPQETRQVNVDAPLSLAWQAVESGLVPVALSTDYVFDGRRGGYRTDDPPAPVNAYGEQKAQLEAGWPPDGLIVRLSKVYGGPGTMLDEMAQALRSGRPVRAAGDQVFCPTHVEDATAAILALCAAGATGIAHVCAPAASRLEVARRVAAAVGVDPDLVEEISLDDLDEPFARPRDTSMQASELPVGMRSVDQVLRLPVGCW